MGLQPLLLLLCLYIETFALSSPPCESSSLSYLASTAMKGLLVSEGALVNLTTSSRLDCTMACSRHPNCTAVNWVPGHAEDCYLHCHILDAATGSEQSWPSAEYLYRLNGSQPADSTCGLSASTCLDHMNAGRSSGVYKIRLNDDGPVFDAFCNMETDGGGWTVFMNRESADVDFDRTWSECEVGFGNLSGNHWLGLTQIRRLTEAGFSSLRVDVSDWAGVWKYAKYSTFRLGTPQARYKLTITGYSGDIGSAGLNYCNGGVFGTKDHDHSSCARMFGGPWWFQYCSLVTPMALYVQGGPCGSRKCMAFEKWHGQSTSVRSYRFMLK